MKLYVFTALLIVGKYTHLFRMSHLDLLANIHDCLFIYQACFKCVFDMPTRFLYITYEILHFMIWIYKIVIQLNFVKNLLLLAGHMFQVKFHRPQKMYSYQAYNVFLVGPGSALFQRIRARKITLWCMSDFSDPKHKCSERW